MIRVVLDTNIIASATITKIGKPYHILSAFLEGKIEVIVFTHSNIN
jgi:Predicted nucleic acid-binding protein, contains PIN domain